ncbi:MAG: AMP-binding protein [Actinomycetales bacterium]
MPVRPLHRFPVPPGPDGVLRLFDALPDALAGNGPALVPLPTASLTTPNDVVQNLLQATRPDDPDAPLEDDEIAVVLATSGSTGAPRGVLHTAASMQALDNEVLQRATGNIPGAQVQWIAALPVTSMGGFNVLIRALATGRAPRCIGSIGGLAPFSVDDFAATVESASDGGTALATSLVAAQVRRLLGNPRGCAALRACSLVLVGGGPLPGSVATAAKDAGITLTTTYGATETGGGCVFDGQPLTGVQVRLLQADGQLLAPNHTADGITGEIVVNGPMLAVGYRCDPRQTARAFTADGYRTGDIGSWSSGEVLQVQGRADDVITVRGTNVALGAVEAVISALPAVAAVAAIPSGPLDDPAITVYLVLTQDGDRTMTEAAISALVRAQVREHLGAAAAPARILLADQLPTLPGGKIDRVRLRRELAEDR